MVSVDEDGLGAMTSYLDYQYVRKVECGGTYEYKVEKQVNFINIMALNVTLTC